MANHMTPITSERLLLRTPRLEDAAAIFEAYAADPEVTRFLAWRPHESPDTVREFLASTLAEMPSGTRMPFVIESRTGATPIGMIDAIIRGHIATIGYVLARPYWGQGLVTEAFEALIRELWKQPKLHRIQAFCDVEHNASARVMEKCGLEREGTLRKWFEHPQLSDVPRDCLMYAVVRDES